MNIKLHNKYEITVGDKHHTAYNTITYNIFDAIYQFVNYGSFLAVGSGTEEFGYNHNLLSHHVYNFPMQLEELQCDPSKGTMYAKRTATVTQQGFTFNITELGLTNCNSNMFNSEVFSHVYIRDEAGQIIPIYKAPDVDMFVRVTMYLEVDEATRTCLTAGENLLVKAVLGELGYTPKITVARGYNNTPNNQYVYRNLPRDAVKIDVNSARISADDGTEQIEYSFDARSGETAELVLLFNDSPVARVNTIGKGSRTILELAEVVSQSNYTLDLGENIVEINQVTDTNGNVISDYKTRTYAKDFTDFIANPFESNFTSSNARWVSYDGDKLAFVADNTVYVYVNKNYALYKVSNNISATNLKQIIMFENYIFAIHTSEPYFSVYTINENMVATQISTDMQVYDNFDTTYDWQEVQIIKNNQSDFTIGIVLGSISRRPVIVKASLSNDTFVVTQATYGYSDYIVHTFSLYKNNFCNSMIGFVTNNYNNTAENYRIEQWYDDGTYLITNEIPAYYLCNETVSVEGKSRAVIAKKTTEPYIWLYYYPQVFRYSISLTQGVENWISTNLMYIIQKYNNAEEPYKIYSLNNYNNPQEFINGFPKQIDLSTVTDFEFLADTLLIFTTGQTYALNLKINNTVLENMPQANAQYNVQAVHEKLIGTDKTEGVMGSFKLVFNV